MTITSFVIPNYHIPYDKAVYCHIPLFIFIIAYIHTITYTYTRTSLDFSSFPFKNLLVTWFKHHFACWLLFNPDSRPLLCPIFAKIEPSSTESTELPEFERVGPILDQVSNWDVVRCLCNSVLRSFVNGLIQKNSKPSPWISNFWGFKANLGLVWLIGDCWDLLDNCGIVFVAV